MGKSLTRMGLTGAAATRIRYRLPCSKPELKAGTMGNRKQKGGKHP